MRQTTFKEFLDLLKSFRTATLMESRVWSHYYIDAIDCWIKVAKEESEKLKLQAQNAEPIVSNIYIAGEALQPRIHDSIFVGRKDLKERLAQEIWTAPSMPLFLIQGQRRVGKTSLLNFLPELLGPRIKVIHQDLQKRDVIQDIPGWLKDLRQRINKQLDIPDEEWKTPSGWLDAWREMCEYLESIIYQKEYKLVLAFDEYETLQDIFKKDCERGKELLAALRSFSQQQNQVVFLFVGARFFSELKDPNWNQYFVHAKHFCVDYLEKPDCIQLITRPIPDFKLFYPEDLADRIFTITAGHPTLVQQICSEMVNIANRDMKTKMTDKDLEEVIETHVLNRENNAINIFLTEFCTGRDRVTINQILEGEETPSDKISISHLERHKYIIKDGKWKIRAPIFEEWLRKFADTFE